MILSDDNEGMVFSSEWKFPASLRGTVELEGRLTEPLTLVVAMAPREPDYDWDHSQYQNYLALHLDHQRAWLSMKKAGTRVDLWDLSTCILEAAPNTSLGLQPEVVTTYWLSYDRENMVIKYGKGHAMEQTTLIVCDFAEGAKTGPELASKRAQWNIFFGLFDPARLATSLLLYRQPGPALGETPGPLVTVRKEPLTANPSPFVLDSSLACLSLLEANLYTFSGELPPELRVLYDTVRHCELESGEMVRGPTDLRLSCAIR